MTGCFGNSAEDRYRERELNRHLDAQESAERELEAKIEARKAAIYGDLEAFNDYMVYGYEGFFAIARQLNRAICLAENTDATSSAALHDAVVEIKAALDAHIENTVKGEQ